MRKTNKPGYTLVLALMVIALIVAIVTVLADRGSIHMHYVKTMIDREKAKALAWSGVQIAMSELAHFGDVQKKEETISKEQGKEKKSSAGQEAKQELISLLPILNKWQIFDLKRRTDGVTGQIKICLGSEDGKLNLNGLVDFKAGKISEENKKILKEVFGKIQKIIGSKNLFESFEKFVKESKTRLQDLTQLLSIKEFELFGDRIFYVPDDPIGKDETGKLKQNVYLQDLFTLWSSQKELDPWMLSHSQKILFGFPSSPAATLSGLSKADLEKKLKEILKNFSGTIQFPKEWDEMLASVYGVKFDSLPKQMKAMLGTKFEPKVFSVVSYGTVGGVIQKLLVILERKKSFQKDSSGKNVASFEFSAKKFYWL